MVLWMSGFEDIWCYGCRNRCTTFQPINPPKSWGSGIIVGHNFETRWHKSSFVSLQNYAFLKQKFRQSSSYICCYKWWDSGHLISLPLSSAAAPTPSRSQIKPVSHPVIIGSLLLFPVIAHCLINPKQNWKWSAVSRNQFLDLVCKIKIGKWKWLKFSWFFTAFVEVGAKYGFDNNRPVPSHRPARLLSCSANHLVSRSHQKP